MSFYPQIKQFLLGRTLPTSARHHERLNNAVALTVLAADALSSVAYATEEILKVLVLAGSAVIGGSIWVAVAITLLLLIITLSYQQTIRAYPNGGGAYIVAHDNLGLYPGLIAAAALMIDYVLTVTVSIASGVDNLTSIPLLQPLRHFSVELCLLFISLIMLANLRGVRESGRIFMIPTYAFIVSVFLMIGVGFFKQVTGHIDTSLPVIQPTEPLSVFLILRAFSQGCTALTGVEAISNGVPAFKPPESKNARLTMVYMGLILGIMFLGVTYFAKIYHIVPNPKETVISQLAHNIFGYGLFYNFVQVATLLILLLAANTSYADFPRLSSLLARDGFAPRQLALLGERLVYSNGIILLSLFSAALIIVFKGSVDKLISLFAVGVFMSFALSQAGMVRHWFRERSPGWHSRAFMNGLGSMITVIVLLVILQTKFLAGAWVVVVAIPVIVSLFLAIHRHYRYVVERLSLQGIPPRDYLPRPNPAVVTRPAVVIVGYLHRGTVEALDYARTIADEIVAVHVDIGNTDREKLQKQWRQLEPDIPLKIIDSPYRALIEPIVNFVSQFEEHHQDVFTTVIIPAFVPRNWWASFLHNQTALFLKTALRAQKSRVVTTVRYYL